MTGRMSEARNQRLLLLVGLLVAVALITTIGCSGSSSHDTGITVAASDFDETAARDTLEAAVTQVCQKTSLGISGPLASALRVAETARATQSGEAWLFSSGGDSANVNASGTVDGDLLKQLTADC